MHWSESTAPLPFLDPRVLDTIASSQPRPTPRYRAPLWQWLVKLLGWLCVLVMFFALVCGPALIAGK